MKLHWADVLPWGASTSRPRKTRTQTYFWSEYEKNLRTTTLLEFDHTRSAVDNLRRLEVGQGFQVLGRSHGFWSGSRKVPGRFMTCNKTLIIRIE